MTITLRKIDASNWEAVTALVVDASQASFVRPNWYSMLQVLYIEGVDLYQRAIYQDEVLVGYAMMGQDPDDKSAFVSRLMIGAEHQRKGYGRASMRLILDDLKARYTPDVILIRVVPANTAAYDLYKALDFVDTGEITHGELVLRLDTTA